MMRTTRTSRRWLAGIAIVVLAAALQAGCARKAGVIFEPLPQPIVYPPEPDPARVRYVGQLATSADLKPAVPFGQALGETLFGKKPARSMLSPYALCTDNASRLFVADSNGQVVHVFDLQTRKYARLQPAPPVKQFSQPVGIAWDPSGRLFVADSVAGRIHQFDRSGRYLGEIGRDFLSRPCGIAYDPARGRLIVADAGVHQVLVLSADGTLLHRIGGRGTDLGQFNFPTNVTVDRLGRFYVSDSLNFRVQQFGADLKPIRQIGSKGDMPGYFGQPKGLATDADGHLYVVDANFEAVQIFSPEGQLLLDFGHEGRGPGEFWLPAGIFIDAANRIWVADSYNRRVQVFDYLPEVHP